MPGRRKRKERQQGAAPAHGADGRWDVLLETRDRSELRSVLLRLRAAQPRIDAAAVRADTLCGRSDRPTTYRLSLFVPTPGPRSPGRGTGTGTGSGTGSGSG
ncbi:hypothetical protein ACWGH3_24785 [Streptomyces sp. NPDC054884]|uniref:hypothetical protein n=1 Tax=Streptomyces sp. ME08-AFT2 TaxID=3028683 RepID=UPI0029B9AD4D|nr:hypothetical protein [Streptomyces sp. ME08-AFT2]MDX3309826.1 hypothetical protein [Streptomyces sp. ME08-AFT2]